MIYETRDHKPDDPLEEQRINECGGEVRTFKYDDGWEVHRIFLRDKDFPGLCMSRSFGDEAVKNYGVTAEPEVGEMDLDLPSQKPFVVMGSDGIWEFLKS